MLVRSVLFLLGASSSLTIHRGAATCLVPETREQLTSIKEQLKADDALKEHEGLLSSMLEQSVDMLIPESWDGMYCDALNVNLCPAGYYCPDKNTKTICPENNWCFQGFMKPKKCDRWVNCPEGSARKRVGVGALVGFFVFMTLVVGFSLSVQVMQARSVKRLANIAAQVASSEDHSIVGKGLLKDGIPAMSVDFEDVSMRLRSNGKTVLSGLTGHCPAHSFVALMGPSGSGKTSLMKALCGRADYGHVSGTVRFNGKTVTTPNSQELRGLIGFVPQDDILHVGLSVQQNLRFSALLRLPSGTSWYKADLHVQNVLVALGLDKVAALPVGAAGLKMLSGSQRKRVNVGMELAAMPALLFMDEPTSGLDSAASIQMAKCLANLRDGGLTIICVMAQTRWSVYCEFTQLLLLGPGGRLVYCGSASMMPDYFMQKYFHFPGHENPADWMLDIVAGLQPRRLGEASDAAIDRSFKAPSMLFQLWDDHKGRSTPWDCPPGPATQPILRGRDTPDCLSQTRTCLTRCQRQWGMVSFALQIGVFMSTGAVVRCALQDLASADYFGMVWNLYYTFLPIALVCPLFGWLLFGKERLQCLREFRSGTSCFAYWFAKMLFGVLELLICTLGYTLAVYYVGPLPAQGWWKYFFAVTLSAWYYTGAGSFISVVFTSPTLSLVLSCLVPLLGDTLNFAWDTNAFSMLASHVCGQRWSMELVLIQEMEHLAGYVHDGPELRMIRYDAGLDPNDTKATPIAWLCLLGLVFRVLALCFLLLLNHGEGDTLWSRCASLCRRLSQQPPPPKRSDHVELPPWPSDSSAAPGASRSPQGTPLLRAAPTRTRPAVPPHGGAGAELVKVAATLLAATADEPLSPPPAAPPLDSPLEHSKRRSHRRTLEENPTLEFRNP